MYVWYVCMSARVCRGTRGHVRGQLWGLGSLLASGLQGWQSACPACTAGAFHTGPPPQLSAVSLPTIAPHTQFYHFQFTPPSHSLKLWTTSLATSEREGRCGESRYHASSPAPTTHHRQLGHRPVSYVLDYTFHIQVSTGGRGHSDMEAACCVGCWEDQKRMAYERLF